MAEILSFYKLRLASKLTFSETCVPQYQTWWPSAYITLILRDDYFHHMHWQCTYLTMVNRAVPSIQHFSDYAASYIQLAQQNIIMHPQTLQKNASLGCVELGYLRASLALTLLTRTYSYSVWPCRHAYNDDLCHTLSSNDLCHGGAAEECNFRKLSK